MEENTARLLQLEEDLIGVTQKGLQKETELDWYVFFPPQSKYTFKYRSIIFSFNFYLHFPRKIVK